MNQGRRRKQKENTKWIKVPIIVIAFFLICSIIAIFIAYNYFIRNIKYEEVDKNDLEVNEALFEDVSKITDIEKEEFNKIVSFAFFGTDSRDVNNEYAGRSDSIMIASINPIKKSIKFISIPRDTYVNIPNGYGWTKINHAYAYGQEQLSLKTINSNFGLDISEYVTIDFSGLVNVINDVGGIELEITEAERQYINMYIRTAQIPGQSYEPVASSGKVTLTGEQALSHSRNRYVGDDFDRAARQREVVIALIKKLLSMDETKVLTLTQEFLKEVKTNINVTSYLGLLTNVITTKDTYLNNIVSTQVPSQDYADGQMIDGVYYFVGDLKKCKDDFVKYIYDM